MKPPIKSWAGKSEGQCWCGKKGTGIFRQRRYCTAHLEQEVDRDERNSNDTKQQEDADHLSDYLKSVKI